MDTLKTLRDWMQSNRMKLNPDKTQYIWIGSKFQLSRIDFPHLSSLFPGLRFQQSVRNLGVTLDQHLTMSEHVGNLCSSCFWQLRQLRQIRRSLSDQSAHILIHAFIISRLDYCNVVLHGVTIREQNRLQTILNASARVLSRTPKFQRISTFLRNSLHWLPISQRVRFKVILMVWNSLLGRSPRYLQKLCLPASSNQFRSRLRSSQQCVLLVPACHSSLMQRRGFAVMGPSEWNRLPTAVRVLAGDGDTVVFRSQLKTFVNSQ